MTGSFLQLSDEQGNPISDKIDSVRIAQEGILHYSSHVWVWRTRREGYEVLLQKRADSKATWPGFWDISAAGHVDYGESPLDAAMREAKEELGLSLDPARLALLYVHRYNLPVPGTNYTENEFRWVYAYRYTNDIIGESDGEVSATRWTSAKKFYAMVEDPDGANLVDQMPDYFLSLHYGLERVYENH